MDSPGRPRGRGRPQRDPLPNESPRTHSRRMNRDRVRAFRERYRNNLHPTAEQQAQRESIVARCPPHVVSQGVQPVDVATGIETTGLEAFADLSLREAVRTRSDDESASDGSDEEESGYSDNEQSNATLREPGGTDWQDPDTQSVGDLSSSSSVFDDQPAHAPASWTGDDNEPLPSPSSSTPGARQLSRRTSSISSLSSDHPPRRRQYTSTTVSNTNQLFQEALMHAAETAPPGVIMQNPFANSAPTPFFRFAPSPTSSRSPQYDAATPMHSDSSEDDAAHARPLATNPSRSNRPHRSPAVPAPASPPSSSPTELEERVARQLILQLLHFQGCAAHSPTARPDAAAGGLTPPQSGLLDIYDPSTVPFVLNARLPLKQRNQQWTFPATEAMATTYSGREAALDHRPVLNLALDRPDICPEPTVTFDVDSVVAFLDSLAALRKGLFYYPVPNIVHNIKSSLHLKLKISASDIDERAGRISAEIQDVPHCLLGAAGTRRDTFVFILFPRAYSRQGRFTSLTEEQADYLTNHIIAPAFTPLFADEAQHLFLGYRDASAREQAKQTEARASATASYQSRQRLGYRIEPQHLGPIWAQILTNIRLGPHREFDDPQLLFNVKDLKIETRHRSGDGRTQEDALRECIASGRDWLLSELAMEHVSGDDCYIDLAKESTPPDWSFHPPPTPNPRHQTYFYRRCCLEALRQNLHGDDTRSQHTLFPNYLMHDAANMRLKPSPREPWGKAGVRYSQYYTLHKCTIDAAKTYPFQQESIEELAIDPRVRRSIGRAGGVANPPDLAVAEAAYSASKLRLHGAMEQSAGRSYGVREEYRIPLNLALCMRDLLDHLDHRGDLQDRGPVPHPSCYCWVLPSDRVGRYVINTANKFAAGYELVAASAANSRYLRFEQTQLMVLFLRLLRYISGANDVPRESALWLGHVRKRADNRRVTGLGLSQSLPATGYPWILPVVDWTRYVIKNRFRRTLLVGTSLLYARYKSRYSAAKTVASDYLQLDVVERWLEEYPSPANLPALLLLMAHLVLRQFRRDVCRAIHAESSLFLGKEPDADAFQLSVQGIEQYTGSPPHLSQGGRSKRKTFTQMYQALFNVRPDAVQRGRWDELPYRLLLRHVYTILEGFDTRPACPTLAEFERRLRAECVTYHWVYPNCNPRELLQGDHQYGKVWWSLMLNPNTRRAVRGPVERVALCPPHAWAGKDFMPGLPPPLPDFLERGEKEWVSVLRRGTV